MQFGQLLYCTGILVQHHDDGRKSDGNTKANFMKR